MKATITLTNFQNADVVIGQPDFVSYSVNQNGTAGANTLAAPNGNPLFYNGILYLPDYANNRVLGFNDVPTSNNASADFVLGQTYFSTRTEGYAEDKMHGLMTVKSYNGKVFVVEYNNNRVLIWNSAPTTTGQPADVVVGQTSFSSNSYSCTRESLDHPISIEITPGGKLIVADSGNNRILIWNTFPISNFAAADVVLGQENFINNSENAGGGPASPTEKTLRIPTGVYIFGKTLIVADAGNNRYLIYRQP